MFNRPELDCFIMNRNIKEKVEDDTLQPFEYAINNLILLNKLFNHSISIKFSSYNSVIYDYRINYLTNFSSLIYNTLKHIFRNSGIDTDSVNQEQCNSCEALFLPTIRGDYDEPQFLPPILDSLFDICDVVDFTGNDLNNQKKTCLSNINIQNIGFSHQKVGSQSVSFSKGLNSAIIYFIYTRMMLGISSRINKSIDLYDKNSIESKKRLKIEKYIKNDIFFSPYIRPEYKIPAYFKPILDVISEIDREKVLFTIQTYPKWCHFINEINEKSKSKIDTFSSLLLAELLGVETISKLYIWENTPYYSHFKNSLKLDSDIGSLFFDDFILLNLMLPPPLGRLNFNLLGTFTNNNLLVSDEYKCKNTDPEFRFILQKNFIYYNKFLYRLIFIAFPALNTLIEEQLDIVFSNCKINRESMVNLKSSLDTIINFYAEEHYTLDSILQNDNNMRDCSNKKYINDDSRFKSFYYRKLYYNPFNRYFNYSEANYLLSKDEFDDYKKEVICSEHSILPKAKLEGVLDVINKYQLFNAENNGKKSHKLESFKLIQSTHNALFSGKINLLCIHIVTRLLTGLIDINNPIKYDSDISEKSVNNQLANEFINIIQDLLSDYNNQECLNVEQLLELSKFIKSLVKGSQRDLCYYQYALNGEKDEKNRYPKKIYNIGKSIRENIEKDDYNMSFFISCIEALRSNDLIDFQKLLTEYDFVSPNGKEETEVGKVFNSILDLIYKIKELLLKWILKFTNLNNSKVYYDELNDYIDQLDFQYLYKYVLEKQHLFLNPSWKNYSKLWDGLLDKSYYNIKYNL